MHSILERNSLIVPNLPIGIMAVPLEEQLILLVLAGELLQLRTGHAFACRFNMDPINIDENFG
ncbi:hypothetical protein NKH60_32225 [Mesorhizobium sp. M1006]